MRAVLAALAPLCLVALPAASPRLYAPTATSTGALVYVWTSDGTNLKFITPNDELMSSG